MQQQGSTYQARLRNAGSAQPLLVTVWAGPGVTEVGWSARERAAQSTLKRAAVQPEVNLHRESGVLDRAVQIARTSELDVAADRAQRGAAAELERAVSFHGAVDRLVSAGRPENLISRLMKLRSNAAFDAITGSAWAPKSP